MKKTCLFPLLSLLTFIAMTTTSAVITTYDYATDGEYGNALIEVGKELTINKIQNGISCLKSAGKIGELDEAILKSGIEEKTLVLDKILASKVTGVSKSDMSIDDRISKRLEILGTHRNELSEMQKNKNDYSTSDFNNMYSKFKYDYNRLSQLRTMKTKGTDE